MRECWISGKADQAVVRGPEGTFLVQAGGVDAPQPYAGARLDHFRSVAADVYRLELPDQHLAAVRTTLDTQWRLEWTLHSMAAALDASLNIGVRNRALSVAAMLAEGHSVEAFARRLFLSVPLSDGTDISGLDLSAVNGPARAIRKAIRHRAIVEMLDDAWHRVMRDARELTSSLSEIRGAAVFQGGHEALLDSVVQASSDGFRRWLDDARPHFSDSARRILRDWGREVFSRIGVTYPKAQTSSVEGTAYRFQLGDKVIYPSHGLGVVQGIENKTILGISCGFYHLRMVANETIVAVPVNDVDGIGLRRAIGDEEIDRLFALLGDGKIESHHGWKGRFKDNSDRMRTGSIYDVVEVLKSLTFLANSRNLSFREKRMLDRAKFLIISEISEVSGETADAVERKIDAALERAVAAKTRAAAKKRAKTQRKQAGATRRQAERRSDG